MDLRPKTKLEAKTLGVLRYFTGKSCLRGHIAERLASNGTCLDCHSERMRNSGAESRLKAVRRWRERNPDFYKNLYWSSEQERKRCAEKRKPPEVEAAATRAWRARYPDRAKKVSDDSNAVRRSCIPPWADRAAIKKIYQDCRAITEETGIAHQVDHIIPIRGANVCGLHVPENLRIITASENQAKRNTFIQGAAA